MCWPRLHTGRLYVFISVPIYDSPEQTKILTQTDSVIERDVAQWLERGTLPMMLPAMRLGISLGAGFSEKFHVSPLSILGPSHD